MSSTIRMGFGEYCHDFAKETNALFGVLNQNCLLSSSERFLVKDTFFLQASLRSLNKWRSSGINSGLSPINLNLSVLVYQSMYLFPSVRQNFHLRQFGSCCRTTSANLPIRHSQFSHQSLRTGILPCAQRIMINYPRIVPPCSCVQSVNVMS
jgi:hypothetical protein